MDLSKNEIYIMLLMRKRFLEIEVKKKLVYKGEPIEDKRKPIYQKELENIETALKVIENLAQPPQPQL